VHIPLCVEETIVVEVLNKVSLQKPFGALLDRADSDLFKQRARHSGPGVVVHDDGMTYEFCGRVPGHHCAGARELIVIVSVIVDWCPRVGDHRAHFHPVVPSCVGSTVSSRMQVDAT